MGDLISVITPAYNAQATIGRAVRSVQAQSFPHWEMLIISDDGVDYRAVLEASGINDQCLRFFNSPYQRSGPNATRNVGLQYARGTIISPLDADDFYYPHRFETLLPLVRIFGIASANVDVCNDSSNRFLYQPFAEKNAYGMLSVAEFVKLSTPLLLMMKRQYISGPWNPLVCLGEDTLFNLRAVEAAGGQLPIAYQPLHSYRIHQHSICHSPEAADKAETAYGFCLQEMAKNGMGFKTQGMRAAVVKMLMQKRLLNRSFSAAQRSGYEGSFQDFIAAGLVEEGSDCAVVG